MPKPSTKEEVVQAIWDIYYDESADQPSEMVLLLDKFTRDLGNCFSTDQLKEFYQHLKDERA